MTSSHPRQQGWANACCAGSCWDVAHTCPRAVAFPPSVEHARWLPFPFQELLPSCALLNTSAAMVLEFQTWNTDQPFFLPAMQQKSMTWHAAAQCMDCCPGLGWLTCCPCRLRHSWCGCPAHSCGCLTELCCKAGTLLTTAAAAAAYGGGWSPLLIRAMRPICCSCAHFVGSSGGTELTCQPFPQQAIRVAYTRVAPHAGQLRSPCRLTAGRLSALCYRSIPTRQTSSSAASKEQRLLLGTPSVLHCAVMCCAVIRKAQAWRARRSRDRRRSAKLLRKPGRHLPWAAPALRHAVPRCARSPQLAAQVCGDAVVIPGGLQGVRQLLGQHVCLLATQNLQTSNGRQPRVHSSAGTAQDS